MPVFRRSAKNLASHSPLESELGEQIREYLLHSKGSPPNEAEVRSWNRSLPVLGADLVDAGLGDVEVLIEYQLPLTSKRADTVLAGLHPETGENSYVVVELKQWSSARTWEDDPTLVTVDAPGGPRLHPVLQVRDYCEYISEFVSSVHDPGTSVRGVAYLHNAVDNDVRDLHSLPGDDNGQLFTHQQRGEFLDFLRSRLSTKSGARAADRLVGGHWRPSRPLMSVAADEIRHREQFTLLDEQHTAYRTVLHAVEQARSEDRKNVVIISGGPGSGKSVIALSLLGELYRNGTSALHATGSRSFTQTMRRTAGRGSSAVQKLFTYFNSYMQARPNDLDVLICDEAHRIRETSENRFTRADHRTGRKQVDELVSAARVPVFLLDQHQVVRSQEMGTVDTIREFAESKGLRVHHISLDGQWRCGGSEKYERWVRRLLGLEPGGPVPWEGDENFRLATADSPWDMENKLRPTLDHGYTARISAGFCWPWSKVRSDGTLVADVRIGDWHRPWNNPETRAVNGAPPHSLWATASGGFDQVGCVYTAQGFEYDWSGVIIGPDLLFRDGRLVVDRSASEDADLRKKRMSDTEAENLIRNVYKVLLTRGLRGTLLYSTDPETHEFLTGLIHGSGQEGTTGAAGT
ncbi:hypothetical protein FHX37_2562 [Haloactinospora alba]|uniref:AAA+ ATPase domain-containing protein n=1 Tax=Haloactinospora alba TaxID=405555 RepID=A0A543NL98_9ACTN|nr:DUF2075 domain-containing protein [Haloactinospora alba]TQN32586.1 hypothetical protein FHX37_2562 [Haloactinospora alba]